MQVVEVITQVSVPTVQIAEKQVPTWSTQVVEKIVEVPHVLREEQAVEVPQIQTCEVIRQDAVAQTREVIKQIPRSGGKKFALIVFWRGAPAQPQTSPFMWGSSAPPHSPFGLRLPYFSVI